MSFFQLDIPRRSSTCIKKGERLVPGMEYYSLLLKEDDSHSIRRLDYCSACWREALVDVDLGKSQGYWKSRIEIKLPKEASYNQTRTAKALTLLKDFLKSPTDTNEAEVFVLSLLLARARQLLLRKEFQENGFVYLLYEIAGQDEFVTIKKIELPQLKVQALQASLSSKLC